MLNKLGYVVVRENLNSSIIRSQVIDILSEVSYKTAELITLVWFYRVDYLFRKEESIRNLTDELSKNGIDLVAIPFVSLKFPVSWYMVPLVLPQWLIGFGWIWWRRRIRQFHCRSYHAALIGVCAKQLLPIKIIFDPRSPFPEENLVPAIWGKAGLDYYFWKNAEKYICQESDVVVAISEPFKESLKRIAPNVKVVVIPNNYPKVFMEGGKVPVRYENCSNPDQMCYLGSLGNWNAPAPYVRFLKYLVEHSQIVKGAKFIVPSENMGLVHHALQDSGLEKNVSVLSVGQEDVVEHASDCIAGMQIMSRTDDRLSIKFVEYLASGMPVIVSENVRGAAYVADKLKVGFVLKSDMSNIDEAVAFISKVSSDRAFWRKRCVDTANRYFSPRVVADELVKIYESIK